MRRFGIPIAGLCVAFFLADSHLQAQPPNRGGQGQQGRGQGGGPGMSGPGARAAQGGGRAQPQTPPLLRIFDANGDGELSENEINNAATALRKLDTDRNGRLSAAELRPSGSGGQSGPGGQRDSGQRDGGQRNGSQRNSGQRDSGARGGQQQGRGGADGGMRDRQAGPGARNAGGPPERGGQAARGGRGSGGPGSGGPGGGGGRGGGRGGGDPARGDAAFAAQLIELDGNQDGQLSLAELPSHMHDAFKIADADKNGNLSNKEQLVLSQQFRRDRLPPPAEQGLERKNEPTQGRRPSVRQ